MAFLFTAASSQYLIGGSAPLSADGCSFSCWYRPSGTAQSALAVVGNATTGARIQLWADMGGVYGTRFNNALTNTMSSAAGSNTAGTWVHCAATFDVSGGNITAYRNGVAGTPVTNPGGAITLNRMTIGARYNGTSYGLFADGDIADLGVWNQVLNAGEIAGLAKGFACRFARPSALTWYSRLIRNAIDLRGGVAITNTNGATVSTHPRIIYPC